MSKFNFHNSNMLNICFVFTVSKVLITVHVELFCLRDVLYYFTLEMLIKYAFLYRIMLSLTIGY